MTTATHAATQIAAGLRRQIQPIRNRSSLSLELCPSSSAKERAGFGGSVG
jgi:hypothetical protein